jgi:hypothetical protein
MATINHSPAGQTTVTLSGISLNGITATASPTWRSRKLVQGGSFAVAFVAFAVPPSAPAAPESPIRAFPKLRVRT